jgi:hypothetical protein
MLIVCGAKLRFNPRTYEHLNARDPALAERYLCRAGGRCKRRPVAGSTRCRLHGGSSAGPKTPEGKARSLAAAKAGRARWVAITKSEGKPFPCGRKKAERDSPLEEWEQSAYEKRCHRRAWDVLRQIRIERRALRVREQ